MGDVVGLPASKTIDGYRIELGPLPAWSAFELFARLVRLAGPALPELFRLPTLLNAPSAEQGKALGALMAFAGRVDVGELMAVCRAMIAGAVVFDPSTKKGGPLEPIFDTVFQGKLFTVLKLFGFALEVQFGGFFAELRQLQKASAPAPAPVGAPSSPSTRASDS